MADIERFTPDDRRGIEQLHRRTLGNEAADRLRLRWDWVRRNPAGSVEPPYWVVREGPTLIAAMPLLPVLVTIGGIVSKGRPTDQARHRAAAIFMSITMLLILAGIPWKRALFPGM